jgi:hypothetical protein
MSRHLFSVAELAALVGILAAGYLIVTSSKATAISVALSDGPDKPPTAREVAPPAPPQAVATAISSSARPPVPLQVSRRSTYRVEDTQLPAAATDGAITEQKSRKEASEATAKAVIEADGYKNVRFLVKAPDGTWRGLAMRGAVEIAISIDASGSVSAE